MRAGRLRLGIAIAVLIAGASIGVPAQPPAPTAQPAPPGGQRGGRGRGVQIMTLTTPA